MFSGSLLQYEQTFMLECQVILAQCVLQFRLPSEAISMTLKLCIQSMFRKDPGKLFSFCLLHLFFYLVAFLCFRALNCALDHPIEICAEVNNQWWAGNFDRSVILNQKVIATRY